jgi:hypothetical protein
MNKATYQTGADVTVRAQFINNGVLANTKDNNFRAISNNWPVFALSHDIGTVTNTPHPLSLFALGHIRDPALSYITAHNGRQNRSLYFWSQFSTAADVVCCTSVTFKLVPSQTLLSDCQLLG